jgi:hypothetical protein
MLSGEYFVIPASPPWRVHWEAQTPLCKIKRKLAERKTAVRNFFIRDVSFFSHSAEGEGSSVTQRTMAELADRRWSTLVVTFEVTEARRRTSFHCLLHPSTNPVVIKGARGEPASPCP